MRLRLLLTMALTMASLAVGSTVQAAPPRPQAPQTDTAADAQAEIARELREVLALEPFYDAEAKAFDAPAALAAGVGPTVVKDFQTGLQAGLRYDRVAATQSALATASTTPSEAAIAASGCVGSNLYARNLILAYVYVDSCKARLILAAMAAGAGVANLTSLISGFSIVGLPIAVIAVIAAALLNFGTAAVGACSYRGRGMVMRTVYWPPCYNQ